MPWTDLLVADRIIVMVEPGARDAVLDAAARLLGDRLPDATHAIASGLRARELIGSTGIGRGVAIPHVRGPMVRHPRGAFLRLAQAVDFGAPDGRPVDLVFAMCAPEDQPERHLHHLAGIAERFADTAFLDTLRNARDLPALRHALLAQRADPQAA